MVTSFAQLVSDDTNGDGKIDSSDAGYAKLEVWEDTNGDGIAEAGELFSLSAVGYQSVSQTLSGNTIEAVSSVTMADGTSHEIAPSISPTARPTRSISATTRQAPRWRCRSGTATAS